VAKLLVLDRMLTFSAAKEQGGAERLSNGWRVVMILVVTGNLVGLGSYIASALFYKEAGDLAAAAAASNAANITSAADDGSLVANKAKARASIAEYSGSFQEFSFYRAAHHHCRIHCNRRCLRASHRRLPASHEP
jgi:hypothetical protein